MVFDSDIETAKNFQMYIKHMFPEIKDVSLCRDPSVNVAGLVRELAPRLILADARFFGAAGCQVLRDIYECHPDTRFILYGTYNDTDYMRRSLEFGVMDYLFKPVKPADFQRGFKGALEYFKKEDERKKYLERITNQYRADMPRFEAVFATSLLHGLINSENEIKNSLKYFGLDLPPGYTVFLLRIDHYKKIILTLDEIEKQLLSYKISMILKSRLESVKHTVCMESLNSFAVIVGGGVDAETLIPLCEGLLAAVYEETAMRATIGVGRSYDSAADITVSYREAIGAHRYRFLAGYNSVIHIDYVEPENIITYRYPLEKEERLVYSAAIGEYEYCRRLLRELFDALKESEPIPKNLISKIIMDILISINRYLSEQKSTQQNQLSAFFPAKEVLQLESLAEAFTFMDQALKKFCGSVLADVNARNSRIIAQVKQHIDEKYYQDISLSKLAFMAGTTPGYLNKIFMESESRTVMDYLLSVRMSEAKRLMRETTADDELIAIKAGFGSARRFRAAFRQTERLGTAEYRLHGRG
jgi:two-component system response regulator YesN